MKGPVDTCAYFRVLEIRRLKGELRCLKGVRGAGKLGRQVRSL